MTRSQKKNRLLFVDVLFCLVSFSVYVEVTQLIHISNNITLSFVSDNYEEFLHTTHTTEFLRLTTESTKVLNYNPRAQKTPPINTQSVQVQQPQDNRSPEGFTRGG